MSRETCDSQHLVELADVSPSNTQYLVEISDTPLADNVFELRNTKVEAVRAVLFYFYNGEYNFDHNVSSI